MKIISILLTLLVLSGCNFHEHTICQDKSSRILNKKIGIHKGKVNYSGKRESIELKITKGKSSPHYTFEFLSPSYDDSLVISDAKICRVGRDIVIETKNRKGHSLYLLERNKEKNFTLHFLGYDTRLLKKDRVPYQNLGQGEFGSLLVRVDNSDISSRRLLKYLKSIGSVSF